MFVPHASLVVSGRLRHVVDLVGISGPRALGFFFALSGFVLTWSARPGDTVRGFFQRRFARIYPAYLVTLAAAVVVTGAVEQKPLPVGPFVATVFSVQAWFPGARWYYSYNGVDWTISCEVLFYLLFPLLIRPLAALDRDGRRRVQVAMLAVILAFTLVASAIGNRWLVNQFPVARLPEFVLGCTLALDIARGDVIGRRLGLRGALAFAVVTWAVTALPIPHLNALPLLTIPMLALLNAGALADLAGQRSVFTSRPVVWFGKVSFCFYLVHQLVLKIAAPVALRITIPGQGLPWAVLCFGLATVLAWVLHRWVEIPGNRLLRGMSRRRDPVTMRE